MKINKNEIEQFISPYYKNKDIMHNMRHIELIKKKTDEILKLGNYTVNYKYLMLAMCFHGFIYSDENRIRQWLAEHGFCDEMLI